MWDSLSLGVVCYVVSRGSVGRHPLWHHQASSAKTKVQDDDRSVDWLSVLYLFGLV